MVAPLTPLKRVKCSYDDCFHSFDTEDQMKVHLKNKVNHPFYCGKTPNQEKLNSGFIKCDFHGKTWEDLLAHKVESMMPWIAGDRKDEAPKKLNHIVCEFCGLDFGSLSGREAHRKQVHTAEQHIVCKGYANLRDHDGKIVREECGMVFGRPSQLIHHIEGGNCRYIKPKMLEDERRQKRIVKQILHDPSRFNVRNLAEPLEKDDSSASGGVDLIDWDDSSQTTSQSPFSLTMSQASKTSSNIQTSRTDQRGWPGLPSSAVDNLNTTARGLSINSSGANLTVEDDAATVSSSSTATAQISAFVPLHRRKAAATAFSISSSPSGANSTVNDDGTSPPALNESNSSDGGSTSSDNGSTEHGFTSPATPSSPWSTGQTSSKLFGAPKLTSNARPNWDAINEARKRTQIEDDKSNLFYSKFWDINSPAYNPQLFLVPEHQPTTYRCPFENCWRTFGDVEAIGDHIRQSHAVHSKACPLCGKSFDSLTQFLQHCEASSRGAKCQIARRPGYSRFLFEITGGLLSATRPPAEPVYGYKTEPTTEKHEELSARTSALNEPGVRDYDYEAVAPAHPATRYH